MTTIPGGVTPRAVGVKVSPSAVPAHLQTNFGNATKLLISPNAKEESFNATIDGTSWVFRKKTWADDSVEYMLVQEGVISCTTTFNAAGQITAVVSGSQGGISSAQDFGRLIPWLDEIFFSKINEGLITRRYSR